MLSIFLSFLYLDAFLFNALWIWNKFLDGREMVKTKAISEEKTKESLNEIFNRFFFSILNISYGQFPVDRVDAVVDVFFYFA